MAITVNPLSEDDIPGMHHEIRNSHGYLKELGWIEDALYKPFRHHYKQIIDMKDLRVFVIRVDGVVAGAVEVETQKDSYFIGYWLGVNFRRKGVMTRCVADIIKHDCPEKLPITARTPKDNTKSSKILLRLGFKQTHNDSEWVYYKLDR